MNQANFWDDEPSASEFAPFMDQGLKQRIADECLAFAVLDIRDGDSKHGPCWMVDVEFEGERWTLPLSHTAQRDRQLARMRAHIAESDPVRCGLKRVTGRNGTGWVLVPPVDGEEA